MASQAVAKDDEEALKRDRRAALKTLNSGEQPDALKSLDSSLKRHTALIKRMRQSLGVDNRDQVLRDIDTLTLEKYVDEIASAAAEGAGRCKTEKDVWSAIELISALHRRFPATFTPALFSLLGNAMAPPARAALAALTPEQREREETLRVTRQRPLIRVCAELALVGIIRDGPNRSGGEWMMKTLKELLSNDPSLFSLPLLSTFLKSYARPFLGIMPHASSKKQVESTGEQLSSDAAQEAQDESSAQIVFNEDSELVEKEIRDRFRKMCEGYFDSVSKKLVKEHLKLQEQDRRNHEAYIRSGEIFEDRQQAYEKMTKSYEKLLASCQTLSDLLCVPLPKLPSSSVQASSILVLDGSSRAGQEDREDLTGLSKWEDDEERKFYEDIPDLKDFVPRSVLGIEDDGKKDTGEKSEAESKEKEKARQEEEIRRLEQKMESLAVEKNDTEDDAATPTPTPPRTPSPQPTAAPGPSQLLTTLLARLPDATNRSTIDQAAVDFAFLNSKAARNRLVRFLGQVPKSRTDLLPHYARLVAILNPYMPDVGAGLISTLEDEFRYLQRKKNVVKELSEPRMRNIAYLSALTKFSVVPSHLILHIFKVFLDDFTGVNVDNVAMLLEGCGKFLMRSDETKDVMGSMVELMRRKQSMQHFDQRQVLLLENAYYQCNPPERAPRQEKQRIPMEQFIRHLVYDVLEKKTIDKVLRLIRKLDWEDTEVRKILFKIFTKPWKVKYGSIGLLAMLTCDLQRYHPDFAIAVVDQVVEDVRRGMEQNVFKANQRRIATVKYLGELYIYRLISSGLIFSTLWSLVTFGHPDGRPFPGQPSPIDAPDDYFRIRLVCILLDGCGMCFDRGSLKKKLDAFLSFFQLYVLSKNELPMDVDFMLTDTLEALRPKLVHFKTYEEAAQIVDELAAVAAQKAGVLEGEESAGGESEDDDGRRDEEQDEEDANPDEEMAQDRPASPDAHVLRPPTEHAGPSEEAEADFAKELAKMMSDEGRKVDKKAVPAILDVGVLSGGGGNMGRKRRDEADLVDDDADGQQIMKFTVISRRGNKQQTRELPIPASSSLAVHTRSAQLQDKVEQQQLKKLVLDYEQREGVEEMKALEASIRKQGIRVKYAN
ncbi:hypothetical protein BOTBODRAFT_50425 [Botryobasidium botryosum FD-172 SS1]|uniref:MIF4G domain-containing protein n=1 Tax=Botryobasidium botryosum (strain FD-172 SS1) TaxID=930990 RepID=A0A067N1M2_BOTB1|nr:hypothetical protein BOTBODRAFT_50425 [Botryobasidium botryosum FD-172 SS1]